MGRPPDRHSRVSGNPDGTEKTRPLPPNRRRIPAYAGMTVEMPYPSPDNATDHKSPCPGTYCPVRIFFMG